MFKIVNQSNYLAKVVRLDHNRKHSNADRLLCWNVEYKNVITDLSYNNGEVVIYFPELSQINSELLSYLNLYNDKTLNQDPNVSGYFSHKGIVKTQSFRGEKSEGFVLKFDVLKQWLDTKDIGLFAANTYVSQEFDYVGEIQICNKYEPPVRNSGTQPNLGKKQKVSDILIPDQFRFHVETSHLEKNLHKVIDKEVIITWKLHGSSCILSRVKGKRQLKWYEKILLKLGVKIITEEYVDIYSSGKPKSGLPKGIVGQYLNTNTSFYATNIWEKTYRNFEHTLEPGITLYGEIVGQGVQGNYDYSKLCNMGTIGFLVYRITRTNDVGIVDEFTWDQLVEYCDKHNLNFVPLVYRGTLDRLSVLESDTPIDSLRRMFLEKPSIWCTNNVPEEGIVVRTDVPFQAYKLVSFAYKQKESADIENGIINEES